MRMPRATYANVMATAAVVLAMTGTAVAATQINGHNIVDRSTPGKKLIKHTVTATEIKTGTLPFVAGKGQQSKVITRTLKSATGSYPLVAVPKVGTFEVGCQSTGHVFKLIYTNTTAKPTIYSATFTDNFGNSSGQGGRVASGGGPIEVTVSNLGTSDGAVLINASFIGDHQTLNLRIAGLTRYADLARCPYSFTGLVS